MTKKKSLNQLAQAVLGPVSAPDKAEQAGQAQDPAEQPFYRAVLDKYNNVRDVVILQSGFVALLRRLGFRKHEVGEGFIIIRIVDNIIEQFQPHHLRGFIVRHFHNMTQETLGDVPKELLIEKLHRSLGTLTTDEKLSLLFDLDGREELKIVEDTIDTAYFFYKNGFVSVTKDGTVLKDYKHLPGCVWKDQILPRAFRARPMKDWEKGVYYSFAANVSGNQTLEDGTETNPKRLVSFMTVTGYCLHKFFNTKLKMPIFMDARVSEFPDGRSGKSLHCKAIRAMLNSDTDNAKQCIITDGKSFDPDNRFKYEDLHVSTRVFVIDDVKRGLPIELFFNAIVDGFMRERKGEKEKVKIWCKPILTLNYTMNTNGGSAKDRIVEFEFADFYSAEKTPEHVHGCWFFRDWDSNEWELFDNFMLACVSDYLKAGIVAPDTINLETRKLIDETDLEFINYMDDKQIEHDKDYNKRELFKEFGEINEDNKVTRSGFGWLKQKKFTQWLKFWAQYRPEIAGYKEFRSSGADYIRFFYNEPVRAESLEGAGKNTFVTLYPGKSSKVSAIEPTE